MNPLYGIRFKVCCKTIACLQICLQSGQHRLKLPVTGEDYLTSKTRQTLEISGLAGFSEGTHKRAKNLFVLLLSGRPAVRIRSGVPFSPQTVMFAAFSCIESSVIDLRKSQGVLEN